MGENKTASWDKEEGRMKGDRFEKMVEKYVFGDCDDVLKRDAVMLLRK